MHIKYTDICYMFYIPTTDINLLCKFVTKVKFPKGSQLLANGIKCCLKICQTSDGD